MSSSKLALDDVFFKYSGSIYIEPFILPASGRTFMSYDHGSSDPYAVVFFWESDGCDIQFEGGRVRSTRPGDLFILGEVYGSSGTPNQATNESIASITARIQSYKIERGWRFRDMLAGKWRDFFTRGFADNAIGEDRNQVSIKEEFTHPVTINGIRHPGIDWQLVAKPPGSRVESFTLLRERLVGTAPAPGSRYRERKGLFIVKKHCPHIARTLPVLRRDPKNRNDVDTRSEDHLYDAIRYGLMADREPGFSRRW